MDEKQRNISQLERVVSSLEYHLELSLIHI